MFSNSWVIITILNTHLMVNQLISVCVLLEASKLEFEYLSCRVSWPYDASNVQVVVLFRSNCYILYHFAHRVSILGNLCDL